MTSITETFGVVPVSFCVDGVWYEFGSDVIEKAHAEMDPLDDTGRATNRAILAWIDDNGPLDPANAECYRNVHKSVIGFNPRDYPTSNNEYRARMKTLKINHPT